MLSVKGDGITTPVDAQTRYRYRNRLKEGPGRGLLKYHTVRSRGDYYGPNTNLGEMKVFLQSY